MSKDKQALRNANKVMQFALDNDLEIVSYGLAPNPNGFCYESHNDKTPRHVKRHLERMLDNADHETVELLRSWL